MTYTANKSLWNKYFKIFQNSITTSNSKIYHYTSPIGFNNIINSETMWFSNINFLNDETERKYVFNLIKEYINKEKNKFSTLFYDEISEICIKMTLDVENICNASTMFNLNDKYVASFSMDGDNLNLWNYYTKNPNSLGYNIEISLNEFIEFPNQNQKIFLHGKVIYDIQEQLQLLEKMVIDYHTDFTNYTDADHDAYRAFLLSEFTMIIHLFGIFFKDPCFKSEQEYRLICTNTRDCFYRESHGLFIPYIKYNFPKHCIKSITISPTQKQLLAKNGIEMMLKELGYNDININKSKIPLRY